MINSFDKHVRLFKGTVVASIAGGQVGLNIDPVVVMVDDDNIVHKRFLDRDENIVGADERG